MNCVCQTFSKVSTTTVSSKVVSSCCPPTSILNTATGLCYCSPSSALSLEAGNDPTQPFLCINTCPIYSTLVFNTCYCNQGY